MTLLFHKVFFISYNKSTFSEDINLFEYSEKIEISPKVPVNFFVFVNIDSAQSSTKYIFLCKIY